MGLAGAYAGRSSRNGALALAGGLCVAAAWFLPWCTMHFGAAQAGSAPSSPLSESPYTVAMQTSGGWPVAWLLPLLGLAVIGLGVRIVVERNTLSNTRPMNHVVVMLTLAVCALTVAFWLELGLMAVPQIIAGHAAPGVYLVPGLGAAVMLAGLGLVVAACVQAWRRL